jgi:hypothetical protein
MIFLSAEFQREVLLYLTTVYGKAPIFETKFANQCFLFSLVHKCIALAVYTMRAFRVRSIRFKVGQKDVKHDPGSNVKRPDLGVLVQSQFNVLEDDFEFACEVTCHQLLVQEFVDDTNRRIRVEPGIHQTLGPPAATGD